MVAAHVRYLEAVVDMLSAICHEHEVKVRLVRQAEAGQVQGACVMLHDVLTCR